MTGLPAPGEATNDLLRRIVEEMDAAAALRRQLVGEVRQDVDAVKAAIRQHRELVRGAFNLTLESIQRSMAELERERDEARATAAVLADAYQRDEAPSVETVQRGLSYRAALGMRVGGEL